MNNILNEQGAIYSVVYLRVCDPVLVKEVVRDEFDVVRHTVLPNGPINVKDGREYVVTSWYVEAFR